MVWSIIIYAIVGYILVMFIAHEFIKKFFHFVLYISFVVFAIIVGYLVFKGI